MRQSREVLDLERLHERELYLLAKEALLAGSSNNNAQSLSDSAEFVALVVGSVPEVVNVARGSLDDLDRYTTSSSQIENWQVLVHTLRWQLSEALLRRLSLEQPPGVTWVVVLDRLVDPGGMQPVQPSSSLTEPADPDRKTLREALVELILTAEDLEHVVRGQEPTIRWGSRLQRYYIAMLELLAKAERACLLDVNDGKEVPGEPSS